MALYPDPQFLGSHWVIQLGQLTIRPSQYWVRIGCRTFGRDR